jgi:probable phosphoglycerate mutase
MQAEQLAQRLVSEAKAGARLDAVYSSDLQRARQTAQPFADALGLPLQLREGFRERAFGAFQGHDGDEISVKFPREYAIWRSYDIDFVPPGGESQREFHARVLDAVDPMVAAHPNGRIACVAHGGVLDCIYRLAAGVPLEEPRDWPLLNSSINVVDFTEGVATLVSWSDVAHLSIAASDDGFQKASRA